MGLNVTKIFDGVTVAASASATSASIPLSNVQGYFGFQHTVTGDGTVKFELLVSLNGDDFLEPSELSDIAADIVKTSGPGSDGKDIYQVTATTAKFIKIKATETGTSNNVTLNCWVAVQ